MRTATHPRYADQLRAEAGWMFKRSAGSQKILAIALGRSEPWTSRQCHGHPSGPVARFYEAVRGLVRSRRSEAGHVIAGALAAAVDEAMQLTVAEIERRLFEAMGNETMAQADEDMASYRVHRALAAVSRRDATPEDGLELDAALLAHDTALQEETAWQITGLVYNRALQVARGLRVSP